MPTFDDRDAAILAQSQTLFDRCADRPRNGDFVRFACGTLRRVSHVWAWSDTPRAEWSYQTSDGGSWYFEGGVCSFSGGLHAGVPHDTLRDTGETREGSVWFFHHNWSGAGRGVECKARFRVYDCTEVAT